MRLKSATLRNYRMHRELTVSLDPSRTLIAGPNEAGKRTLVHAIHRALFYRHKSDVDLDTIRSRTVSAAPEVVVEFEAAERTYTLHKVFNGPRGFSATLTDHTTGEKLTGEDAETHLRDLLGVADLHYTKLPRQWARLWVRQGSATEDPTSAKVLNEHGEILRSRLFGGIGGDLNESPRDTSTYQRVAAAHGETFGANNAILKKSDLSVAAAEVETARKAVAEAAITLRALEDAAESIARNTAFIQSCSQTLDEATQTLEKTEADLARIEDVERTLEQQRLASKAADEAYSTVSKGDADIRAVEQSIAARRQSLVPKEEEVEQIVLQERRAQEAEMKASAALTLAVAQQRDAVIESDLLQVVERAFVLSAHRKNLEETIGRIADQESEIARLDNQLRSLPEIDTAQVEELADTEQRLVVTRGKLEAIATRIELISAGAIVSVGGETLAAGEERTLTKATELVVGSDTTIRVSPGGGQTLSDVRHEFHQLETLLEAKLATFGLKGVAEARSCLESRKTATSLRQQLAATLVELRAAEARAELQQTVTAIDVVEAEIARKLPSGQPRPADAAALEADRERMRLRHDNVASTFEQAQEASRQAREASLAATQRRTETAAAIATIKLDIQGLEGRRKTLEESFPGDREANLQGLAVAKRLAEEAVTESERLLQNLAPDRVRTDRERLSRSVLITRQQIAGAREKQAEARGLLLPSGSSDLHDVKAQADARLDLAERRYAEVQRRSRAIELLCNVSEKRRQILSEAIAAPLRKKVAEYLDELHDGLSRIEVTVTKDGIEDLRVARPVTGGLSFTFEALSGGTKEQVADACRLAMAEILAGEETCLPMVFDDAFVNSDPDRIQGVLRVLELGAKRGLQIIVLSCNPHDYGLLGASRVDLAPARFDASGTP
jgi:DNA repair exonuclease SbcCD ATPase subunit